MSEANGTAAGTASGRKLVTVNGKEYGTADAGDLNFVNFKKLAEAGTTGIVAEGIYVGTSANQFDPEKPNFKLQTADGGVTIVNAAGSLSSQMSKIPTGTYVAIDYQGMEKMEKGKYKGKSVHKIIVLREAAE